MIQRRRYGSSARSRKRVKTRSKFRFERRKKTAKFTLYLTVLVLSGTFAWWTWKTASNFILNSDYFRINTVEVRGLKNIAQGEITALLPFRPGDNLFSINVSATRDSIARYKPELKKIELYRGWQKVTVDLQERVPVACVNINGQDLGVDQDNKPFPLRGNWTKTFLPEIATTEEADRRVALNFIKAFVREARPGGNFPEVRRYSVEPINRIVVELKDGSKIFWGIFDAAKVPEKFKRLSQVLEEAGARYSAFEYINLSFYDEGRILVKPRHLQAFK